MLQNQRGRTLCYRPRGGELCATDPVVGGSIRGENPGQQSQAVETEGCRDRHTAWLGENTTGGTESGRTVGVGENGQAGTKETHRQERKETGERDEGQ